VTFSSGGPPFVALVSLSNKGEIQYTGVDARCSSAYLDLNRFFQNGVYLVPTRKLTAYGQKFTVVTFLR